jgi:hypothetical protein
MYIGVHFMLLPYSAFLMVGSLLSILEQAPRVACAVTLG